MESIRVGVGVIIRADERLLVMRRAGAHGAGTWGLPGGHMEFGESPEETAVREVAEEVGLVVEPVGRRGFTDDPMPDIGRHYVTVFVECAVVSGEPRIMEPDKATDIAWLSPAQLCERDLFLSLRHWLEIA